MGTRAFRVTFGTVQGKGKPQVYLTYAVEAADERAAFFEGRRRLSRENPGLTPSDFVFISAKEVA